MNVIVKESECNVSKKKRQAFFKIFISSIPGEFCRIQPSNRSCRGRPRSGGHEDRFGHPHEESPDHSRGLLVLYQHFPRRSGPFFSRGGQEKERNNRTAPFSPRILTVAGAIKEDCYDQNDF